MNAYTQSAFDAMEAAAKAYRDAAIKEIVDNAEFEKDAKVKECDHYKLIAEEEGSKLEVYTYQYDDPGTVIRPLIYAPDDTRWMQRNLLTKFFHLQAYNKQQQNNLDKIFE